MTAAAAGTAAGEDLAKDAAVAAEEPATKAADAVLAATSDEAIAGSAESESVDSAMLTDQNSPLNLKQLTADNGIELHEKTERGKAGKPSAALNVYTTAAAAEGSAADPAALAPQSSAKNAPATPTDAGAASQKSNGAIVENGILAEQQATALAAKGTIAFQGEVQLQNADGAESQHAASDTPSRAVIGTGIPHLARHAANLDRSELVETRPAATGADTESNAAARPKRSTSAGSDTPQDFDDNGGTFEHAASDIESPLPHGASVMSTSKFSLDGATAAKSATLPAAAQMDAVNTAKTSETGGEARSLALKIHSEEHGTANVILTDRAGQVHVTVRANDPLLAQSLRADLGSLAGGLEQQGFAVKLWHPSSGASADGDSGADTSEHSQHSEAGQNNRHRNHSDHAGNQRNRRQQEWTEDID